MKRLKQRLSRAFGGTNEELNGAEPLSAKSKSAQQQQSNNIRDVRQQLQHVVGQLNPPVLNSRNHASSTASSSSQFFPGSSSIAVGNPLPLPPAYYHHSYHQNGREWTSNSSSKNRWSLSDSMSQLSERIGDIIVEEETVGQSNSRRNFGPNVGSKLTMPNVPKREVEKVSSGNNAFGDEVPPVVVMRTKKQQPRQYQSKIKSWHASRWFGSVVHAASAPFSSFSVSTMAPKLGSDGESAAEMSPSTSGGGGRAQPVSSSSSSSFASSSALNGAVIIPQQQTEYVPNVKLRSKKTICGASRIKRLSEQEIQKRLSLPAYINIPPSVVDKLSRTPILDNPLLLSRKSKRASLSEIGFGKLETYKKIFDLGRGTYSTVYLGKSMLTGKSVALKEIRLEHEEGAPCTAIREVSLLRKLKHANIVTLHDVIHTDSELTLVFEYVERDLREYMDDLEEWMCIANVRLFLMQMLRGLAYCHSRRILHRDLKPQNLLITKDGELKLADFGLARAQSVPTKSYSSEVVTLWYRPPDVLLGSTDYSTHIDMWGVGCILYEMLSHKPMFPGNRVEEQLDLIFRRLGTPTPQSHPELCALPVFKCYQTNNGGQQYSGAKGLVYLPHRITQDRADLLQKLLVYDGKHRISALNAMRHPFLRCFPKALFELPDTESVLSIPEIAFVTERKSAEGELKDKILRPNQYQ